MKKIKRKSATKATTIEHKEPINENFNETVNENEKESTTVENIKEKISEKINEKKIKLVNKVKQSKIAIIGIAATAAVVGVVVKLKADEIKAKIADIKEDIKETVEKVKNKAKELKNKIIDKKIIVSGIAGGVVLGIGTIIFLVKYKKAKVNTITF